MVARDPEGYLLDFNDWSPAVAVELASQEGLTLDDEVWRLIELIQQFYVTFDHSPSNRPLAQWIKRHDGPAMASTLFLRQKFPTSPPKQLALIAGLPRPENCL